MVSLPAPDRVLRLARQQVDTGLRLAREQADALAALPGALVSLTRAVSSLDTTIREAKDTVSRLQKLGERLEGVLDEVEQPVKDLAPGLRRGGGGLGDPAASDPPPNVPEGPEGP